MDELSNALADTSISTLYTADVYFLCPTTKVYKLKREDVTIDIENHILYMRDYGTGAILGAVELGMINHVSVLAFSLFLLEGSNGWCFQFCDITEARIILEKLLE